MNNDDINNGTDWQKGNAQYLSAVMAWLRACMEQFAAQQPQNQISVALPASARTRRT